MKILLDENLPRKLKADFGPDYEVKTVRDMEWLGFQQNLDRIELAIFVLLAVNNRRETLQKLVEKIKDKIKAGGLQKINEIS